MNGLVMAASTFKSGLGLGLKYTFSHIYCPWFIIYSKQEFAYLRKADIKRLYIRHYIAPRMSLISHGDVETSNMEINYTALWPITANKYIPVLIMHRQQYRYNHIQFVKNTNDRELVTLVYSFVQTDVAAVFVMIYGFMYS